MDCRCYPAAGMTVSKRIVKSREPPPAGTRFEQFGNGLNDPSRLGSDQCGGPGLDSLLTFRGVAHDKHRLAE